MKLKKVIENGTFKYDNTILRSTRTVIKNLEIQSLKLTSNPGGNLAGYGFAFARRYREGVPSYTHRFR